jgi:hypothetical protein
MRDLRATAFVSWPWSSSSNPVADFTRRLQKVFTIPPSPNSASSQTFSVISAFSCSNSPVQILLSLFGTQAKPIFLTPSF